ncbi:MAG: hypothetical protein V7765_00395 [Oleispira sp.]
MNFKTNLLSAAIAASLLTACGGESSNSSDPVVVDPAPVEVPDVIEEPTVPSAYTFTDFELLGLGKTFISGLDAQAGQLASALGETGGGILGTIDDLDEEYQESVEDGFYLFMGSVGSLGSAVGILRDAAENGFMPEPPQEPQIEAIVAPSDEPVTSRYELGVDFPGLDANRNTVNYIFTKNNAGNVVLTASSSIDTDGDNLASSEVQLTYVELSEGSYQVLINSTLVESNSGMYVRVTNAGFTADEGSIENQATVNLNLEKILVVLNEVTATASINAEMVVGSAEAQSGTYEKIEDGVNNIASIVGSEIGIYLPSIDAVDAIVGMSDIGSENDGDTLNLASFEISDFKVELATGEYLSLDSLLFEDADAADYIGVSRGYGEVASYEFNEAADELVLSNEFGSTTYTYTAAQLDETTYSAAQITCVTDVINYLVGAPKFDVNCDEETVTTGTESLTEYLSDTDVYTGFGEQRIGTLVEEGEILTQTLYSGIDSRLEPITFSVAAKGQLGLAGGLTIPYQFSLNHPGALNYQAQMIVGAAPALTATFSTQQEDVVVSTRVPYIPADAAFEPTAVVVEFRYSAIFNQPEPEEETDDRLFGTLTVNGVEVAHLKELGVLNETRLEEGQLNLVLTYVDGTNPRSGMLFSTVDNVIEIECPANPEQVILRGMSACYADQSGVINTQVITDLFFDGLHPEMGEEEPRLSIIK